jgi:hypothetical protein
MENGVIFVDGVGKVWNGLKSVSVKSPLTDVQHVWVDGEPTVVMSSKKSFEATVYAFTYPEEFDTPNVPHKFGFAFQSSSRLYLISDFTFRFGNMVDASFVGTQNPENFEIYIFAPTSAAVLEIDLSVANEQAVADLMDLIHGTDVVDASLPDLAAVLSIFETYATMLVVDHGDGTWTASGPDEVIQMLDSTTFEIFSDGARYISDEKYRLSSW